MNTLGVRTAKGDFTERAAARVQTSRGTPKMQPKTSHRATPDSLHWG